MANQFIRESREIEYKKSESKLSKSFWETYSSFSNSKGGIIYLGVSEEKDGIKVTGVKDVEKTLQD
ncbi:TPA: putative DNA binding domain-containing protein, partial [Staphylococcus pseudintermedius]|nr:putative DNA binding domain-containing protein [Staphylococcus pseudintermedius]